MPWRDLPERFGYGTKAHRRSAVGQKIGAWEWVLPHLAADTDDEYAMIDSTTVRAHQPSAAAEKAGEDKAIGRLRGGLSTKIHALVVGPATRPDSS